jgi:homopolymeric O-antigen transport system permease protein
MSTAGNIFFLFFPFLKPLEHHTLIGRVARRTISSRYRGSFLGFLWAVITPIVMLAVYTFVFSKVFQFRWGGLDAGFGEFAMRLFAGLIVFNFFAENATRAPELILENVSFVKKVIFPVEILPITACITALFNMLTSLAVLLCGLGLIGKFPSGALVYLPVIWLPFMLMILGITWFLSAVGVYFRDLKHIITTLVTITMFLSPIFYPVTALPEGLQKIIFLNPLTFFIQQSRAVLIENRPPETWELAIAWGLAWIIAFAGYACFRKMKPGFGDVI